MAIFQTQKNFFFINENKSFWSFEILDFSYLFGKNINDLQRLIFIFDKNFFVILFKEFELYVLRLLLEIKIHNWLACVYIQNCHWHKLVYILKHKNHDTITYLKFKKIFMSQHIKHFICSKIPYSKAFVY